MTDGEEYLGFSCGNLSAAFRKNQGMLCSIRIRDREWLSKPIRPVFWRAPVSNDAASAWPFEKSFWKGAELYSKLKRFSFNEDGPAYVVETEFQMPTEPRIPYVIRYHFQAGAQIKIELDCHLPYQMEPPFVVANYVD